MHSIILLISIICQFSVSVRGQVGQTYNYFETLQRGDGTYYGGNPSGGNCQLFPVPNFVTVSGMTMAALNIAQYQSGDMSQGCGMCLQLNETGTGSGASPIRGPIMIYINDKCPECPAADVDLGVSGDGRWGIQWKAVNCPVGAEKLSYMFEGSNPFYVKLQVRGNKVPIFSLEFQQTNGAWLRGTRTDDNFFLASGYSFPMAFPVTVRVTGVTGEQLIDRIANLVQVNRQPIAGSNQVQFCGYNCAGPAPPTSGMTNAPTTPPTSTTPNPTSPPVSTPTLSPTNFPTNPPTLPGTTAFPTRSPTNMPTSAPTQAPPSSSCLSLVDISGRFNTDRPNLPNKFNRDNDMTSNGLVISGVSTSTVNSGRLVFNFDISIFPLSATQINVSCTAIQRVFDLDYNNATKCWKYTCQLAKKRQSSTSLVVTLAEPASSGTPAWVVVVAIFCVLIFIVAVILVVLYVMNKNKKEDNESVNMERF